MTINESVDTFLRNFRKSEATKANYETATNRFYAFLSEKLGRAPVMDDLYDEVLEDFYAWLVTNNVKESSAATYMAGVSKWLSNAMIRQTLPAHFNYARAVALFRDSHDSRFSKDVRPPEYFTDIPQIVSAALALPPTFTGLKAKARHLIELRNRAFIFFLYATPARQTAARTLKLSQVLYPNRELREEIETIGKGNKKNLFVLNHPQARQALKEYLDARGNDGSEYVFISHDHDYGQPISRHTAWDIIKNASKACGLDFSPHDFRHFWGIQKLEEGEPIELISQAMAHSSVAITNTIYARFKQGDLVKRIKATPMPVVQ